MAWLLPRVLATALSMMFAAALGWQAGYLFPAQPQAPLVGAGCGIALGALGAAVVDGLRGWRLIGWLRGAQDAEAPRVAGYWGELAYRVERAIRLRERDIAQSELRLAQFRAAIEASPNGVMILDAGDHIEWCNSVCADHFGLDPQRDVAQRVTNLVRAPAFVAYLQRGPWDEPVAVAIPGRGGVLSVQLRRYGEGQKLVLSQDVTERERADAMRRDFVANVSHEIRTPLTIFGSAVETLRSLELGEVERERLFDLVMQQTAQMKALVDDLLALATLESSPRPPADRRVPLAPLMRRIEAEATALSAGRQQRIAFDGDDSLVIAGAERELYSAVANLVNNAVRYTPPGGSIDVRWRRLDNGSAEIVVTDSGAGIAREHLPRLGQRFYRVDGSRSRDSGGTGLGLSIVKHVMQRHGGELDVRSEVGKGSAFRLVLPPARVRQEEAAASEAT